MTVRQRALHIETLTSRNHVIGPNYTLTLRHEGGEWKGSIEAPSVEDALRIYNGFKPGTTIEVPSGNVITETPPVRDTDKLVIFGALAAMVLFFVLPILWMFGVRNWFTSPARLALLFGLGALTGAAFLANSIYTKQTTWPRVTAAIVEGRGLERLKALGAEVTMNDYSRTYLDRSYDVASYTFKDVNYEYAITYNRTTPPCQRGESCSVLVNPAAPADIANLQPLDASTFAGAIALAGMGLVFTLVGLFV